MHTVQKCKELNELLSTASSVSIYIHESRICMSCIRWGKSFSTFWYFVPGNGLLWGPSHVLGLTHSHLLPGGSVGKESTCNAGDPSSIPGLGSSPGEGIGCPLQYSWASLVAQTVKNPPAMQETCVQSLGGEDPLEKGMATHSSILAWRIPWTEEPGGLQSMGSQRGGHDWMSTTLYPLDVSGAQPPTPALPVLTTAGVSGGHNRCWLRSTWVRRPLEGVCLQKHGFLLCSPGNYCTFQRPTASPSTTLEKRV